MFPSLTTIFTVFIVAFSISIIGLILPKKFGFVLEMSLILSFIVFLFYIFTFREAIILFTVAAMTYAYVEPLFSRSRYEKRQQRIKQLQDATYVEITQTKKYTRLFAEYGLTGLVSLGGLVFLLFAPDIYSVLKFFIILGFIVIFVKTLEKTSYFFTSMIYWLPEEEKLIILSRFQHREYPMSDLKKIEMESSPDLLKLHPLFTFLSATVDMTNSFQPVLKLSFPGEHLYLTPDDIHRWSSHFQRYTSETSEEEVKEVLPLWHPTVLKRFLWKGYFAVAVKGISAYTGLIFLLVWLNAPVWAIVGFVIVWWFFNLYVSDRVLIAATDAKPITEGEVYERARHIFQRANMKNINLYMTDSPIYNGFATGMNIGRGTIIVTSATLELSIRAVEAILAHEAIHVKKRDILMIQFARIVFFGLLAFAIYFFFDAIVLLADRPCMLIMLVYGLFLLYPIYLSFVSQWTEGRADNLGATLLSEGRQQMADGLRELAEQTDKMFEKTREYQVLPIDNKGYKSELKRPNWLSRFIEFQFQTHPPMYWRIYSLETYRSWKETRKEWMLARFTESLPI